MYVASISHGKDSIAMLHVIKDILQWPLDRIITVDVWFDDQTRAELPPMVEWKEKADKIIEDKFEVKVEHFCAMKEAKQTYKRIFYKECSKGKHVGTIHGFPMQQGSWCKNLKLTYKDIFYRTYQKGRRGGQIHRFPIGINKGNYCTKLKNIRFPDYKRQLVYRGTETTT